MLTQDDKLFHQLFVEGIRLLKLTDAQVADQLCVSRPSVSRWITGKNLPHRGMRKPILKWIQEETEL